MSEQLSRPDGTPGKELCRLYETWSRGGTGLLIAGNVMVDRTHLESARNVILEAGSPLSSFERWAAAGKSGGAAFWLQLNHSGRQTPRFINPEPVAPSPCGAVKQFRAFAPPRALEETEIHEIIERFATSARMAQRAGFDGVELHAAHGYLISQFLSPLSNLRTDAWGGSLEKRARFLLETVAAVRAAVGPSFPIGVKLNSADFQRGGFTHEESMEVVGMLGDASVDLIELSGGNYETPAMFDLHDSTSQREAYFLDYARGARERTTSAIMVTGGFRTAAVMNAALEEGALDLVGLARPLALEPALPREMFEGRSAGSSMTPKSFGPKALNYFAEGGYYLAQMGLMARGRQPNPDLGAYRAVAVFVGLSLRDKVSRRFDQRCKRSAHDVRRSA